MAAKMAAMTSEPDVLYGWGCALYCPFSDVLYGQNFYIALQCKGVYRSGHWPNFTAGKFFQIFLHYSAKAFTDHWPLKR